MINELKANLNRIKAEREQLLDQFHAYFVKRVNEICTKYGCTFTSGMGGCWIEREFTYYEEDDPSEPIKKKLNIIEFTDFYNTPLLKYDLERTIKMYEFVETDLLHQLVEEVKVLYEESLLTQQLGITYNLLGDLQ